MKIDQNIINKLYDLALEAYEDGEIPISAIILDKNNEIVAYERNKRQKEYDILGHAEILCVQKAEKKIKDWRLDDMCSMILKKSRIDEVIYILESDSYECTNDFDLKKSKLELAKESREKFKNLIVNFFYNKR